LTRLRLGALLALAVAICACSHAPKAMAAAEVHRLNLVISAVPSQLNGGSMNDLIDRVNVFPLSFLGYEPMKKVTLGWLFDTELRYFVRPSFAVCAGVGQLKTESKRVYLPGIGAEVTLRGELLQVPIHVGGLYYLAPYVQGDFQARTYVGGGFTSLTTSRATFTVREVNPLNPYPFNARLTGKGEGPGYYVEVGAHMFFAARYSLMVGAVYRGALVTELQQEGFMPIPDENGRPLQLPDMDMGGLGFKMAVGIGL